MIIIVHINGFRYFADIQAKILYTDQDKKEGTSFSFLTKNEQRQMYDEIKYPRV